MPFCLSFCAHLVPHLIREVDLVKLAKAVMIATNLRPFVRIVKLPIPHYGVETQKDSHYVRTHSSFIPDQLSDTTLVAGNACGLFYVCLFLFSAW